MAILHNFHDKCIVQTVKLANWQRADISAECSNDLIRAVIVFNGTFKGIIYSSGYVNDPTCLYVNGTGSTRYEFSIRLNQCGTLGRQELHQPTIPGEARVGILWGII